MGMIEYLLKVAGPRNYKDSIKENFLPLYYSLSNIAMDMFARLDQ